jgi:hypothetical protein
MVHFKLSRGHGQTQRDLARSQLTSRHPLCCHWSAHVLPCVGMSLGVDKGNELQSCSQLVTPRHAVLYMHFFGTLRGSYQVHKHAISWSLERYRLASASRHVEHNER